MTRVEEAKELQPLMPVLYRWRDQAKTSDLGVDVVDDEVLNELGAIIASQDHVLLVLLEDSTPIGFMGMVTFKNPFGKQKMASEHYLYVLEERRGVSSIRLITAAIEWAKSKGCDHIMLTASNAASDLHDQVCQLYEHMGMKKYETTYIAKLGG